uniref:Uncharacterized protein n=1 Tax=Triticum urartu TaxID=4572 RepID=A0A8R7PI46_TRIUA
EDAATPAWRSCNRSSAELQPYAGGVATSKTNARTGGSRVVMATTVVHNCWSQQKKIAGSGDFFATTVLTMIHSFAGN